MSFRIERVTSPDDPRLADYAGVRDPVRLARQGVFLAEGRLILGLVLSDPRWRLRSVLGSATTRAWLGEQDPGLPADVPFYEAPDGSLRKITGHRFHQGCLASIERPCPPPWEDWWAALRRRVGPWVLLDGVSNPDNVGAIFRSARALRAAGVVLSQDACSPLYRKALRSGMGSALCLPWWQGDTGPELVRRFQAAGARVHALALDEDAMPLGAVPVSDREVWVLGPEGPGLSAATRAACDHRVRIPIDPAADSLNVAAAAAIALHARMPPE